MRETDKTILFYVSESAKLGKNVKVWHFAYVGDDTEIGDNVIIGSLSHIDRNVKIGSNTKIEGCVYIPPMTMIGKGVFIGPGTVFTNDPYPPSNRLEGVVVEDGVVIGARAVIKAGARIGKYSVVAMGSIVTKNVPPNTVVMGIPARSIYSRDKYNVKQSQWNVKQSD